MPTRLEELAAAIPLPADQLRACLRRQIAQARVALAAEAPALPTVRLVCDECKGGYLVAESRAAVVLRSGEPQVCPTCRHPRPGGEPGVNEFRWVSALPVEAYARAMVAVDTLR